MKKKLLIIGIIVVAALLAVVIFLVLRSGKKKEDKTTLFAGTGYPCEYWTAKDVLHLSLDGSKTPDLSWELYVRDPSILEVAVDREEKNGKATYSIKPLTTGSTEITLYRTFTYEDYSYDAVIMSLPMLAYQEGDKIQVKFMDHVSLEDRGGYMIGSDTENPILLQCDKSAGSLLFLKGQGSWKLDRNYAVSMSDAVISDSMDIVYLYDNRGNPVFASGETTTEENGASATDAKGRTATITDAENPADITETQIRLFDQDKGTELYVKVHFGENGTLYLSPGEKPKEEK